MGEPEAETAKKPSSNRSAKELRNTLFRVLDGFLSLSHRKIHSEGNSVIKAFLPATIPVEYVHGEPTKQLAKTEEADKEWE